MIKDDTVIWPEVRPQVDPGILTLKTVLADSADAEKTLMFSPLNLTDGIEGSDDPILVARPTAYGISFRRRLAD